MVDLVVPTRLADRAVLPGEPRYETARQVDNAAIDRRPAVIVRDGDVGWDSSTVGLRHGR